MGVCQTKLPVIMSTAVISPIALLKITKLFFIINEIFLIDFTKVSSVLTSQSLFPFIIEIQFKVLSKSTVKNLSSYILI